MIFHLSIPSSLSKLHNPLYLVDEQEWYLFKHIETEQHELANEYIENASVRPALSVKCRAARRPAYFLWNIFLVTVSANSLFTIYRLVYM